jgi:hypothetical protein
MLQFNLHPAQSSKPQPLRNRELNLRTNSNIQRKATERRQRKLANHQLQGRNRNPALDKQLHHRVLGTNSRKKIKNLLEGKIKVGVVDL